MGMPPTAGLQRPLSMVLVDRDVRFVDQVQAFIQESGGLSYDEAIRLVLDKYKGKSIYDREREAAYRAEQVRYRDEVEGPAFDALRERRRRKAAADGGAAVYKVPLELSIEDDEDAEDAAHYLDMLEGTEACVCEITDAPGVTRLSIKIAWPPPSRCRRSYPGRAAFIAGSHKSLLLLCVGNCNPGKKEPGFYMVYNTQANSVAIVPPIMPRDGVTSRSPHCHVARGWGGGTVAILSRPFGGYLLAELLLCRDGRSHLPTSNKATLFVWISGRVGQWVSKEVELPVPCQSFRADMVFAVGSNALCWVDLLSGVLVYRHTPSRKQNPFHFIPLPTTIDAMKEMEQGWPEEYRSMCCIDDNTLQFVSIEGFNQDIPVADMVLTTWILKSPRSPTKWQWHLLHSVRIGDLWHDPHYNGLPLLPSFPVISTLQPHVIYLSVHNYEYNPKHDMMQATELYVLSLDMRLRGVVSAFKAPSEKNGCTPYLKFFTSDFTRYIINPAVIDLYKVCPRGEEVSDGGESAWTSVWISAPFLRASSSLQMSVQDVGMSSNSDTSKAFEDALFVASVLNSLPGVNPHDPTVQDLVKYLLASLHGQREEKKEDKAGKSDKPGDREEQM